MSNRISSTTTPANEIQNAKRKGFPLGVKRRDPNGIQSFLSKLQPHNPIMFDPVTSPGTYNSNDDHSVVTSTNTHKEILE